MPKSSRSRSPITLLIVAGMVWLGGNFSVIAAPPNILVVIADDCTFNELPAYGGKNAKTPHIDRLAKESLVFDKAYVSEAICQPCRSELYTGLYPMSNGCNWNHSSSIPGTKSMPHHFGKLGYRTGLAGKVHVKPKSVYPFESVGGFDSSCVRIPTNPHDLGPSREFVQRSDDPFLLVVALTEPHVPWVMGDASVYPPAKLELPENIADTEMTRDCYSKYLAEITYMDSQVGELMAMLEETGHANDTLVIFTSEQGAQFPGFKWTNYDVGLHTALMVRWPGKTNPGRRTDALVQFADVVPTLLNAAGESPSGKDETDFDGTSFLAVLLGKSDQHREFAYATHNNIPEGPPYPIRSVTDGKYRYIRNLIPENMYIEKHVMGVGDTDLVSRNYYRTWLWESGMNAHTYELVKRYQNRPAEELYDLTRDPLEFHNQADLPETDSVRQRLSKALDQWMDDQNDPGVELDSVEVHAAAKKGKHIHTRP